MRFHRRAHARSGSGRLGPRRRSGPPEGICRFCKRGSYPHMSIPLWESFTIIVITPTKEVTTETHFVASAILFAPYLSFSVDSICLTAFSQNFPKSHGMQDSVTRFSSESTFAPTRIVSAEEGRQRQFAKDTRSISIQGASTHSHGLGLGWRNGKGRVKLLAVQGAAARVGFFPTDDLLFYATLGQSRLPSARRLLGSRLSHPLLYLLWIPAFRKTAFTPCSPKPTAACPKSSRIWGAVARDSRTSPHQRPSSRP